MVKQKQVEEPGVTFNESTPDEDLVINMNDVTEQTFEAMPRAVYDTVVDSLEFGYSQKAGNPMWTWILEVESGEFIGRKLFFHSTFNEKGLPRTKKTISQVAPELLESEFKPSIIADTGILIGKRCRAKVSISMYEGKLRNTVKDLLAPVEGSGNAGFLD